MDDAEFVLSRPPIVEAVIDIDCDLPPGVSLEAVEPTAREAFASHYPKFKEQIVQEHQIDQHGDSAPTISARRGIQSLQFLPDDEKQIVQVRAQGFSFNRLAPYSTLDNYLPEIERTWGLCRGLLAPVQVRTVRLRYINRILLPLKDGDVTVDDYLAVHPQLRDHQGLRFVGFLNQNVAVEESSGNELNIILATQAPVGDVQPVILDITAAKAGAIEPDDWASIAASIRSLRLLKNRVFRSTVTEKCLTLFQ